MAGGGQSFLHYPAREVLKTSQVLTGRKFLSSYLFPTHHAQMKTIQHIARRLVTLCREQKFIEAYRELYGEEAESIDPMYSLMPPARGLITLIEREKQFLAKATIHKIEVSEPLIAGNYFACQIRMDFTIDDRGRNNVEELCVYHVKNGKIIRQQFFIN
jgi:hypothetical protein